MRERGKKAYTWLPKSNHILLDIGCGVGEFTGYFQGKATTVIGCDISLDNLRNAQRENPDLYFVQCECEYLPFKNDTVGAVVCTDVLEHTNSKKQTIHEIFRVMKEEATMCLSVPYKGSFWFLDVENFRYYINELITTPLSPPLQGGDEEAVRLKVSNLPPSQGGDEGEVFRSIKKKVKSGLPHKHFTFAELKELVHNFTILKYSRTGCFIYPICLIAYRVTKRLRITFLDRFVRFLADADYSIAYGRHAFNIMLLVKKPKKK